MSNAVFVVIHIQMCPSMSMMGGLSIL